MKKFLLDTNAVSEVVKPEPDPGLMEWLDTVDEDRTYLSVITIAELRQGVDRLPNGSRRKRLDQWLTTELSGRFGTRLIPVDEVVAHAWGRVRARTEAVGRLISPMDAFLAATAESHGLTLVTRNRKHFEVTGVSMVDPWTG
ncbi:type II toxin-antitoxin system VapC family toxin [Nocardia transvalensis]|uniref:type II toxin-antitoxin system VapC family toxin n=1 Tax=Nocardia transvalensis TaxID=37333 RepID=UPI0018958CA9|nr:type II toxin-antitoxin system VapC family toxin [Nocardia transvalensis]MBF6329521.1 type II toxin-antitoxin system VapC family toxin [Nocardia transvalensis]